MQNSLRLIALSACLVIARPGLAQLGSWTAHTSMGNVTALADTGDQVWASTDGGVFYVDGQSRSIGTLTAVDGLHAVSAATIAYDEARSAVWVGYADGVLDRIDREAGSVVSYLDISRATRFSRRAINRTIVRGDSLFVCTEFGIVVFDPVLGEVRDSYSRLGTLPAATPVKDLTFAPDDQGVLSVWAATDRGLAIAPLGSANLQDPAVWRIEAPPVADTRAVVSFQGQMLVGTESDVYLRRAGGDFVPMGLDANAVSRLVAAGGLVVGVTPFQILTIDASMATSRFSLAEAGFPSDAVIAGGALWVASAGTGLLTLGVPPSGTFEAQQFSASFLPEGPSSSVFADLAAAPDGSLWAAGVLGGDSFHRLAADGSWANFSERTDNILQGKRSFTHVAVGDDGSGWVASEGGGVVRVLSEGPLELFNESNSSLRSAAGFPGFIVVGGVAAEPDGGLWATTRGSSVPLHYRSADGTWSALPPMVGEGLTSSATAYGVVYIDSFGQKWIILREESNFNLVKGLLVLDTGSDPADPADDSFRFFGTKGGGGQGLPGRGVKAVVEDRDGLVWIGTEEGLAYFVNTGVVARDPSAVAIWPQRSDRSEGTFLYLGLPINDLAVDPANRLWIATDDGVRVVTNAEDGFEEVLRLTTESSPLLSNAVLAIEIVADRGEAFLATDAGLVSVGIDAVSPAASPGDLFVFPNPVVLGSISEPSVTVRGLVDRTDVSIVSGLGEVVARFRTRGGQSRWDLRDFSGQLVPSGVYLVIAVAENGEGTAYGKIAVIR